MEWHPTCETDANSIPLCKNYALHLNQTHAGSGAATWGIATAPLRFLLGPHEPQNRLSIINNLHKTGSWVQCVKRNSLPGPPLFVEERGTNHRVGIVRARTVFWCARLSRADLPDVNLGEIFHGPVGRVRF